MDQIILYDTALGSWITTNFGTVIGDKNFKLITGTPDRSFAEYVSPDRTDPDGVPELPRIALTIEDYELDMERSAGPLKIRKMGWVDNGVTDERVSMWQADYPVPINVIYTINFWTEYIRELNLWSKTFFNLFKYGVHYIDVDFSDLNPANSSVYGIRQMGLYLDSGLMNTGDLEPGNQERLIRRTVNCHFKGYLFDENPAAAYAVKEVTVEFRHQLLDSLLESARTPLRQTLDTGDGVTVAYPSLAVDTQFLPIVEHTFFIDAEVAGVNTRGFDDGNSNLIGSNITSGTVNYTTGAVAVTFTTAPDLNADLTCSYYTTIV